MRKVRALLLRWTARALRFAIPETAWGDRLYAQLDFLYAKRRLARFRRPRSFNDHLFRLRVGPEAEDRLRCSVADKLLVKDYVARTLGAAYALETYAVLTSDAEVTAFAPPRLPCVIKPTHASRKIVILRGPEDRLNREQLKEWLRFSYYRIHRERFYKSVAKRVVVEEFFSEDGQTPPDDYKVFCFAGRPKFIQVDTDRFEGHRRGLYSPDWQRLPLTFVYPPARNLPRPAALEEMLSAASRLAAPFSFIRIDFLYAQGRLKITELTNTPEAATGVIRPVVAEDRLGRLFTEPELSVEAALGDLI